MIFVSSRCSASISALQDSRAQEIEARSCISAFNTSTHPFHFCPPLCRQRCRAPIRQDPPRSYPLFIACTSSAIELSVRGWGDISDGEHFFLHTGVPTTHSSRLLMYRRRFTPNWHHHLHSHVQLQHHHMNPHLSFPSTPNTLLPLPTRTRSQPKIHIPILHRFA